ncbi:Asp-tRNA(Asn)/Glu-tRNA(Gln) amidotransferase subunit GatB [Methylomonas sp. MO1]|uniref:Asp-tRNA(Asn)/Glu-tRNA(Gln) amidotransferase subunit GatB n=1 Tax=Methylomonas sp. MO1 TaxID=3073619 RepID=UPI0028A40912|nr:Asp-tRNA(Asn)/Glu-tRNA(Gln) amidotransferase subunit GatB [Methylomonas sp. MO1]MDT4288879.1 Asp-tRNA(Asn)/Glu-tRNA(Gln) amidotransferase subunit GatB [Methylomonas sp. MO1]
MNSQWEAVIGLEIHTQLSTKSKIFSGAATAYGAEPNTQACAVDLGLPGVLPVLNKDAVRKAVTFGLAIDAEIAPHSVFARKNYFYPDLPKGYQISQFELPIVGNGHLDIEVDGKIKTIRITRAHLEEDAGKSVHGLGKYAEDGYFAEDYVAEDFSFNDFTGIDLNRAGTPLLEIVSEPDMYSAAEAIAYAKKLHELVQWIGICDGNMQEGSFRCDVNVSVRKKGDSKLGTRREIKNLNSFKFMQQAIEYETNWQIERLESGDIIQQATVLFNPDTGETRAMRSKEEANDYRYFPDPDLLPVVVDEALKIEIKNAMPELPVQMKWRIVNEYLLTHDQADYITSDRRTADYFFGVSDFVDKNIDINKTIKTLLSEKEIADSTELNHKGVALYRTKFIVANWIMGVLAAQLNKDGLSINESPIEDHRFGGLIIEIVHGETNQKIAKEKIFPIMWESKLTAQEVIEKEGLKQITDTGAIEAIVDKVIAANPVPVEQYRAGKDKALMALVGQIMKETQGKANPGEVNKMLIAKLKN